MSLFNTDILLFENYLRNLKKPLSESSILTYKRIIQNFQSKYPNSNDPKSYYEFLKKYTQKDYLESSDFDTPDSKRHNLTYYLYAIKKYIEYKIEDPKLKAKILDSLPVPKENPNTRTTTYLTPAKLKEMIELMEFEKHKVISLIMYSIGIRIGDCLKLRREDLILETYKEKPALKLMVVGKRSKLNICHIHRPEIIQRILKFKEDYDYGLSYMFLQIFPKKGFSPLQGFKGHLEKSDRILVLKNNLIEGYPKGSILQRKSFPNMTNKEFNDMLEPLLLDGAIQYHHDIPANKMPNFQTLLHTNYVNYVRDLNQAVVKYGLNEKEFTPHSFRKCYAQTIWEAKKDLRLVKDQLNHSRVETTLRYLRHSGLERVSSDKELQNDLF